MKISVKTNNLVIAFGIIDIILLLIIAIARVIEFIFNYQVKQAMETAVDIFYILLLFYLTGLLKIAKEKKFIIYGFYALMAIDIVGLAISYIPSIYYTHSAVLQISNVLILLCNIYILVVSLCVRDPVLQFPFRIYALLYILLTVINFGVPIIVSRFTDYDNYYIITRFMGFTSPVRIFAILYIIYKSNDLFKISSEPVYVRPLIEE